jgi:hypothetical protein
MATHLINVEKVIIKSLSELTGLPVFMDVPNDLMIPHIEIAELEVADWLVIPKSSQAEIVIKIFSNKQTNQEALTIMDKLKASLLKIRSEKIPEITFGWESCEPIDPYGWGASIQMKIFIINEVEDAV